MDAIAIEIGRDSWRLVHLRSTVARQKTAAQLEISGALEERLPSVKNYISENGIKDARLAIVLPRELSISRVLSIPAPDRGTLDGIIRFELEKHLPFFPSDGYYGYQVLDKKGTEYSVLLGAAVKKRVDDIVASFASAGIDISSVFFWQGAILSSIDNFSGKGTRTALVLAKSGEMTIDVFSGPSPVHSKLVLMDDEVNDPARILQSELNRAASAIGCRLEELKIVFAGNAASICPDGMADNILKPDNDVRPDFLAAFGGALSASGTSKCSINLLPAGKPEYLKYLPTAALCTVAMVLLCLVGGSYVAKDIITLKRLDRTLAELKAKAKKGNMPGQDAAGVSALESIYSSSSTRVLGIIKELTEILPDDSWLTYLDYRDGSVTFEGFSGNAPALLMRLENSKLLDDFEFTAPVTSISKGKEKFRIKSKVRIEAYRP